MTRLLTLREAAERIAVSEKLLRSFVKDGQIAVVPVGRGEKRQAYRIRPETLDAWEREREQCLSAKQDYSNAQDRKSSNTISEFQAIDFMARRDARRAGMQKPSSAPKRRKPARVLPISAKL